MEELKVRKFTPKECFRLMGFDDLDFEKAESFNSNTQLYKQAGNSIVVPVVEHIIQELIDCCALEGKEKRMELKINNVTFPEAIEFNFDEIKQELSSKVEHYKTLVYTDDQIKDAKKDVAELRKFIKALSDERIKVKKQCLAPYEAFEAKVKELESVVNEPIALIDSQVKEYEAKQKEEKLEMIQEYYYSIEEPDLHWLGFPAIYIDKWLNASVSMKSIQEEINSRLTQIKTDLATLSNLPEFGFEATEVYKTTLDINKAISEGHRLAEIQKKKEAQEAKSETPDEETIPVEEIPFADDADDFIPSFDGNESIWRNYRIQMTTDQKAILEQFLVTSGIKYQEV